MSRFLVAFLGALSAANEDVPANYLRAAISVDEKGSEVGDAVAWTNAQPNGTQLSKTQACMDWTKALNNLTGSTGSVSLGVLSQQWTDSMTAACVFGARLYCFQTA